MKKLKILAISGSTRKNSSNESIIKAIAKAFSSEMDMDIYDRIDSLPHFNPDLDNEPLPVEVVDLRDRIHNADGVLFCTPEYVFSLPGSLKNAIEWNVSTTLFSKKPVAIIVASASGQKAFESLHLVMSTLEATISEGARLLIRGAKGKISKDGVITDENTKSDISTLMNAFLESIKSPQPTA